MTEKSTSATVVTRTSAGLRDAIFDELDAIRSGKSNPTRANAVAKLAGSIVETVRMEIEVNKYAQGLSGSKGAVQPAAFPLGNPIALGA